MAISKSLEETAELARKFLTSLTLGTRARVVGLSGDLGSGKTTFVQNLARALGAGDNITSPTFVIEKIYKLTGQKFARLVHVDAYRLENGEELSRLGFAELLADRNNLIVIEWVERVVDILPEYQKVNFKFIDENTREISFA